MLSESCKNTLKQKTKTALLKKSSGNIFKEKENKQKKASLTQDQN